LARAQPALGRPPSAKGHPRRPPPHPPTGLPATCCSPGLPQAPTSQTSWLSQPPLCLRRSSASMHRPCPVGPLQLIPSLTVYQMLMYTAELKRPASEPLAAKRAAVEVLMKRLALTSCRDVKIGSQLSKGISGGQAKRVNIGIALITNPRVLFLDEPTSGELPYVYMHAWGLPEPTAIALDACLGLA
jgi:hypothetical protein